MHRRLFVVTLALLVALAGGVRLPAAPVETTGGTPGDPFHLYARAAILVDQATGRVLYQRNADQAFVPASLAKLMSLHIIYEKLEDRSIGRNDVVSLSANAWANNQAPGSTVMHLGPGQIVTVEELMKGMAVASGNDAATALAEYTAGSTGEFVRLMNEEARFLGYTTTRFTDPAGINSDNQVTAREFADFCRRYIDLHPEALTELHSLREFDYPLAQNLPDGQRGARGTRRQYNPNWLVGDFIGVDGLKTGHLDDENFTAAITARRGDTRLVAVLLGVPGTSLVDGARNRMQDALALLSYGIHTYSTATLDAPTLAPVRVWKGGTREIAVAPAGPVRVTVRDDEWEGLSYSVLLQTPLFAPVLRGQKIGDLVYSSEGEEVARLPLLATADVEGAGLLRRVWDSMVLGLSTFVGSAEAALRTTLDTRSPSAIVSSRNSE